MENISTLSPTELLHMINEHEKKHENLKQEIINHTIEIDELYKKIDEKEKILLILEKNYIDLIEEYTKR